VILLSTKLPTANEATEWGLRAALAKGTSHRRLLEVVHSAHQALRATRTAW
jgi:hypothetical protein